MPYTREIDPLLPQTEQSPEISGYGSSRSNSAPEYKYKYNEAVSTETAYVDDTEPAQAIESGRSRWNSIIATFTFIILFGFIASLLNPRPKWSDQNPVPAHPNPVPGHTIEDRVVKILTDTPLIDGHNDLAIFLRAVYKNDIYTPDFRADFESGNLPGDVDLARLRKGMVGGAFWSAFVVCPEHASTDFSDEQYATAVSHTLQQIDLIKRLQAQYSADWTAAGTDLATMLLQFHATRSMFGPISIEGLHQVPQSAAMSTLRLYYALGVRAATLTWNCHNAFADAALISANGTTKIAPYHRGGLTEKGREVIKEMNRLGMLVDVSHTSYWTQKAALSNGTSRAPIIFSHSSAFELCPHPRNVQDDVLDLVKETESLVMVNFSPDFISCETDGPGFPAFYEKNNTMQQVARHITYIGEKIGYDYVGLGSDYDGMGNLKPAGLESVENYPDLIAELLKMGVSDADASKVVGGNLLRVWKKAEEVSRDMKKEGVLAGQDEVSGW